MRAADTRVFGWTGLSGGVFCKHCGCWGVEVVDWSLTRWGFHETALFEPTRLKCETLCWCGFGQVLPPCGDRGWSVWLVGRPVKWALFFLSVLEKMSILDVSVVCSWWCVCSPEKLTNRTLDFYGRLPVGFFRVSGDCFLLLFPVVVSCYCVRGMQEIH